MNNQTRIAFCDNPACPNYQKQQTVWAQLQDEDSWARCEGLFYDWPVLTCSACGRPPTMTDNH